jgi:anaerobic ribonucleoside-triphosphate reductase
MAEATFHGFRKRSGLVVPFRREKIEKAIQAACLAVARESDYTASADLPARITERVLSQMVDPLSEYHVRPDEQGRRVPCIEDVQDLVEVSMAEAGETLLVASYKRYRRKREVARSLIRVRGEHVPDAVDVTDASLLLVESTTDNVTLPWDNQRIVNAITEHTDLPVEVAVGVAKAVENRIIDSEMQTVNTTLIRELVNNELAERGHHTHLRDLSIYGVPKDFVESLMYQKSTENSNIVNNNPEAVNLGLAELILKQWALDTIFSPEVKRAHDTGAVHLHDLGYPHRIYCSSHSIEYVKKYGLSNLINLSTTSSPARSATVLTGHLNTFLASMQANYAGALGIAYINILYAPLLEGMGWKEQKQIAQELIFNGSQNAFSRGGQTLFLDFNIHSGIPRYLRSVPAIGPGGRYMLRRSDGSKTPLVEELREETEGDGYPLMDLYLEEGGERRLVLREQVGPDGNLTYDEEVTAELVEQGETVVTYGDYQEEARTFCRALLEVWGEGDSHGRIFEFPKCDFHISDETFSDPAQYEIFLQACELASKNGSTYFIFDRDEVTLSACCRLRTTIESTRMLRHPENMRFCGFQNVTVNIPQAAFRASRRDGDDVMSGLLDELDRTMNLAAQAHQQKKTRIAEMMSGPGHTLWQIGQPSNDGKPYVDLDTCTYIIGLIGLNDAIQFLTGDQLHESEEALRLGLKIVAHMFLRTRQLSEQYGLKFTLEESPAESAARRLAKTDLVYFREEARKVVKGEDEEYAYYTNSVHLSADAQVSLVERIRQQAKFHSMIESGAITHAFVGEERPSAEAIARLMKETFHRTQSAQVTISPEFTFCNDCTHAMRGLLETCTRCGSENVYGETRVVGYFSKIQNWNKSKRYGELSARQRGRYAVETADTPDEKFITA